jgi:hypothetical protein
MKSQPSVQTLPQVAPSTTRAISFPRRSSVAELRKLREKHFREGHHSQQSQEHHRSFGWLISHEEHRKKVEHWRIQIKRKQRQIKYASICRCGS